MAGRRRMRRRLYAGLPDANRTTDEQVNDVADRERRVVVTKDADFVDRGLEALLVPLIADIVREFQSHSF